MVVVLFLIKHLFGSSVVYNKEYNKVAASYTYKASAQYRLSGLYCNQLSWNHTDIRIIRNFRIEKMLKNGVTLMNNLQWLISS